MPKPKLTHLVSKRAKPPASTLPAPTEHVVSLPHALVLVSDLNTRQPTASEVKASGLVKSIQEGGQTTPAIVRPHPTKKGHYELAAGARRKTACAVLDREVKCIIRDIPDDEFEDLILTENLQRTDPDPYQEALLVARRISEGADVKTIAARYGQTPLWVERRAKLAQIEPSILKGWKAEDSHYRHWDVEMLEHLALFPAERQLELIKDWPVLHAKNVRQLRNETRLETCRLDVPWLNDPATAHKGCGPGCAHDSTKQETLLGFELPDAGGKGKKKADGEACGHCLNPSCFKLRSGLALDAAASRLLEARGIAPDRVKAVFRTKYQQDATAAISIQHAKDTAVFNIVRDHDLNSSGYDIAPLKAKDKPAEDALIGIDVTDPNKPALVILTARKGSKPAKQLAAKKKATANPEAALKDKITLFQARRWSSVRHHLLDAVEKAKTPELSPTVWSCLAAWFGTRTTSTYIPQKAASGVWDYLAPTPQKELWNAIRPVLVDRLRHIRTADEFLRPHVMTELREIAKLIDFDLDACKAKVDINEIPLPKTWGKGLDPHTCEPVAGCASIPPDIDDEE